MNLELGIAKSCGADTCRVDLLDGGTIVEAAYSANLRGVVTIRPGQLVVVDRDAQPPELVFRAAHTGEVTAVDGDRATVVAHDEAGNVLTDADGNREQNVSARGLSDLLAPGARVFFVGGPEGQIVDMAVNGRPAHRDRVRAAVLLKARAILGS